METNVSYDTALAIVGMAGRFPGANNLDTFWHNLRSGVKSIRQFSEQELLAAGVSPEVLKMPNYVRAGTVLEGAEFFDSEFFGYTPREAELTDPQHRIFLECTYEALQDAAYDVETYPGLIGVFAGSALSPYFMRSLKTGQALSDADLMQVAVGNERDSLASAISYKLNLRGPSLGVQTFCSTSLVAVHIACQSLLNYECDMALAGGVAISMPQVSGYVYEEGGILSPDGECRTFDARGRGSVMGNGAAVVVLKRLEEAIAEGDQIYSVIMGSHINNDGSVRVSYTAPGLDGQSAVIAQAISNAGVDIETVSYIEAHGTATMLGDQVEFAALQKAFALRTQKKQFCAIGSLKPNIGHLDRASGVAGLIKTSLALKHQEVPPSLNFEKASPDIDLANSPFYVNTNLKPWQQEDGNPRRAGVSSFGLGGTNAHVVLEEAPLLAPTSSARPWQLFVYSAKTGTALDAMGNQLRSHLAAHGELNLADIAYTLQVGRTAFNHRRFLVARDSADAQTRLAAHMELPSAYQAFRNRSLTLLFPAVASFDTVMAQELYRDEGEYRQMVDSAYEIIRTQPGLAGYSLWEPKSATETAVAALVSSYAQAGLVLKWGIVPYAVSGAAYGLDVAALVAGLLSLEDAVRLTVKRSEVEIGSAGAKELLDLIRKLDWQTPEVPYLSLATGMPITDKQAVSAAFWIKDAQDAATLPEHIARLLTKQETVFLEIGQGEIIEQVQASPLYLPEYAGRAIALLMEEGGEGRQQILSALGQLWLAGVPLDWQKGYANECRRRVSLPAYPFDNKRYWIEDAHSPATRAPKKEADLARWFYNPTWKSEPLPVSSAVKKHNLWVFEDQAGLATQLALRLEAAGQRVTRIRQGTEFARIRSNLFQIRPNEPADYLALCKALQKEKNVPQTILHCWNVISQEFASNVATFQKLQVYGFHSLMALVQGLNTVLGNTPVRILTVANGLYAVEEHETIIPEKSTLLGATRVIPQENLGITCRAIDVVLPTAEITQTTLLVEQLFQESLATEVNDSQLAFRTTERLVQTYESVTLPETPATKIPFRQGGVYLITGGMGGVGPVIAEHIGTTYKATIILMGRSEVLPRTQWQTWIDQHGGQDDTSLKLKRLIALEEGGGRLVFMQGDVGDIAQVRQVVEQIHARFGALHGILHAAGVTNALSFKSTQEITPVDYEMQVRPKVQGLYALEEVLQDYTLDFCLLFSSISVILGGITFSAYVAGNVFLDAFAQTRQQNVRFPWLCINWDTWDVKENMHGAIGATVAEYSMRPEEACEVLTRVLAHRIPRVIVSTGDLQARIKQWIELESLLAAGAEDEGDGKARGHVSAVHLSQKDFEKTISEIWQQVLGLPEVGLYDNFFDLGGNSLIGLQVISKLKKAFNLPIPAVALYEAPTVSALARYLLPAESEGNAEEQHDLLKERRDQARQSSIHEEIAIIGMNGRFPGASNVDVFWENLRNGVESISFFTEEELIEAGGDPRQVRDPAYVKARPVLTVDIEKFDALFFGYSPREAELTDPQQRLFLECAWEALELAGYDPVGYDGLIGVFAGTNISTYMMGVMNNRQALPSDNFQMLIGNEKDALTTSVSYKMNLKGPSYAVQTFCSTSLVAVHLACQSLLHGESDIAMAGGVSILVPEKTGHMYEEGGMESPDGHCRTFDSQAKGSMFGDGVGIVVLKRLSDALADGDIIHAVIKGSAINNDGSLKVSYTAPSVVGQSSVVTMALEAAGISPESISYVEAHGTATELGDPIEVASLTKAYRAQTDQVGYCAIGSVKTNVGHLDRASGVGGLIKTVMALKHKEIPANLHFQEPNPEIDFENSPFYVNTHLSSWETDGTPRRAGINSLGLGGTNAHVIVEEAPEREASGPSRPWQLLTLSARTASALAQSTQRLYDHLQTNPELPLADVAYTLQVGRKLMDHRRVIVCRDADEALSALNNPADVQSVVLTGMETRTDQQVAFLFPGVGERYIEVAQALYHTEDVFRSSIDSCHVFLQKEYGLDLHSILQLDQVDEQNSQPRGTAHNQPDLQSMLGRKGKGAEPTRTALAQPAVFVVEYALAQLFLQWGLRPQAMLGYSLGEYVAACLAGVFSLKDALRLVASRAQLIDEVEAGAMLAVMLSEEEIQPYLSEQVNLAILNSQTACVLAGPIPALERLEKRLLADDVACRRVETTHAFHSQMLSPLAEKVTELAQSVKLHTPQVPYVSNVTGTWITDEQATDPAYWAQHMCQTVRFAEGAGLLLEKTDCLLLEVGPGQALSFFAKQHPAGAGERREQILPTLPAPHGQQKQDPHAFLLSTLGRLWLAGVPLDWQGYYATEKRQRVILPTYPFERQRYWIERGPVSAQASASGTQEQKQVLAPAEILVGLKKEELSDWFYLPGWKHTAPQLPANFAEDSEAPLRWLLFQDELGISDQLHEQLLARGHHVVTVKAGTAFARHSDTSFTVRSTERADYALLLLALQELQQIPQRVVHFWGVTSSLARLTPEVRLASVTEKSFYSLMALAQALGEVDLAEACKVMAVSNDLQDVTGAETICPEKAVVIGPARVIAQEYPMLSCCSVDIAIPDSEKQRRTLITHLLGEVLAPTQEPIVALRRTGRWLLTFEPVHIPEQPLEETPLRAGGTYLITGGLGGIGLAMANYLARTLRANLVLTSRSGLPAREQWEQIIQEKGTEKGVGRQISQVLALETLGSSVLPLAADVSNANHMVAVVQQTIETYGALHGVIHAAGLPAVGLMQNKTAEQAASVMAPKLEGTLALEHALRDCDLDFLVFFSSITSATGGGPGQIDYCAGNAYMDAYALQQINSSRRTIAINWGEWQWNAWDSGLSGYDEETQAFFRANRQAFGISFEEGAQALQRILAQPFPEVIVSTQDFGAISQLSRIHTAATALEQFQQARGNRQRHERPPMRNEYTAPQTEMERTIVGVWEDILGIDGIGIKDNFFDLGGNSLVGIELITQVRKALQMQTLPSYVLYEAPTIETMAAFLSREENPTQEQQENRQERSDKRRENLKLRMRERVAR